MSQVSEARDFVRAALQARADPDKAAGMQAYMKTEITCGYTFRRWLSR